MKQLLILSGKGGTGKTTVASAFIKLAQARAFADCDVDAPNLHLIAQREGAAASADFYGLNKACIDAALCTNCGKCAQHCRFGAIEAGAAAHRVDIPACEGCAVCTLVCPVAAVSMEPWAAGRLSLYEGERVFSTAELNMGSGNSGLLVTEVKKRMRQASNAEFAIIDGSPGIGCPVIASVTGTDLVLAVAEPSLSGLSDLERVLKTCRVLGVRVCVCVNKADLNQELAAQIEEFCEAEGVAFVGEIPFDSEAVKTLNAGKCLTETDGEAKKAIEAIYSRVMKLID